MPILLSARLLAAGILLLLGGIGTITSKGGSVAVGVLLVVFGLAVTGPCMYAQVQSFRAFARATAVGPARSTTLADPAVRRRLKQYGATVTVVGIAMIATTVWLSIPGTVAAGHSNSPVAATFAHLLCPGTLVLTVNVLLIITGLRIPRGDLHYLGRAIVGLRMNWGLALLVLLVVLIVRATPAWPAIAALAAAVFFVSFSVDVPLTRLLRTMRPARTRPVQARQP